MVYLLSVVFAEDGKESSDDENPLEESDDGDDEGKEMDYDSSSSARYANPR